LVLRGHNNFCSTIEYLQYKNGGMTAPFAPTWRRVRQQLVMTVWFWTFCCNCKPVDKSRWPRKDKFGVVSEVCNRQKNA